MTEPRNETGTTPRHASPVAVRALLVMACPMAYVYVTEPATPVAPVATPQTDPATNGSDT